MVYASQAQWHTFSTFRMPIAHDSGTDRHACEHEAPRWLTFLVRRRADWPKDQCIPHTIMDRFRALPEGARGTCGQRHFCAAPSLCARCRTGKSADELDGGPSARFSMLEETRGARSSIPGPSSELDHLRGRDVARSASRNHVAPTPDPERVDYCAKRIATGCDGGRSNLKVDVGGQELLTCRVAEGSSPASN